MCQRSARVVWMEGLWFGAFENGLMACRCAHYRLSMSV